MSNKIPGMSFLFDIAGKIEDFSGVFEECSFLEVLDEGELDTSNASYMRGMFSQCINLKSIPKLNTKHVLDMKYMFYKCISLTTIPCLDTKSVTDMTGMFHSCYSLKSVPAMNVSNVKFMSGMFGACRALETIDMYGMKTSFDLHWSTKLSTEEINKIFRNCGQASKYATITLPDTKQARAADVSIVEDKGWKVDFK